MNNERVLIVYDSESSEPTRYSAKCTNNIVEDIKKAVAECEFEISEEEIKDIANEMLHNRSYWFEEQYCFDRIFI